MSGKDATAARAIYHTALKKGAKDEKVQIYVQSYIQTLAVTCMDSLEALK